MKTPQELRNGKAGQTAKFLDGNDKYSAEHLQAALANALKRIDALERRVEELGQTTGK